MKHWLVFAMLAAAACDKTSDLPAMQHEMAGLVKNYSVRFDELEKRGSELTRRLKDQPAEAPGLVEANNTLAEAGNLFRGLHDILGRVPNEIKAATSAGKPDQLRQIADSLTGNATEKAPPVDLELELGRVMDALEARLEHGYVEINADLDAVDSALWLAERAAATPKPAEPKKADAPAPTPAPPATTTPAAPAPTEGASAPTR
jgi:hypothetical protein